MLAAGPLPGTGLVFTIKQEVDTDMFESVSSTEGQDPSTEQEMVYATIKQEDEEEKVEPNTTQGEGGRETGQSILEEILLKSYTHPSDDESFNLRMSLSETSRRDEELGAASCQQTIDSKLNAIEAELLKMKDKVSRMETLLVELHKVVVERSKQTTERGQPYEGNESLILIGDSEHAVHVDKRRFQRAVHLATSVHLTKQTTERGQPYKAVEGNESLILIGDSEYAVHVDKRRFQRAVHLANSGRALLLKLMSMVIQPDELGNFSYRGDRNMEPPLDSLIDDDRFKAIQLQPVGKWLKSRHSLLHTLESLNTSPHNQKMTLWSNHLQTTPHKLYLSLKESLATGSSELAYLAKPQPPKNWLWMMQSPNAETTPHKLYLSLKESLATGSSELAYLAKPQPPKNWLWMMQSPNAEVGSRRQTNSM
eukprot:XP_003730988.2 PREDICTED: uncharacterized protein LOC100889811 [Strongylocentrotus purpuratus]